MKTQVDLKGYEMRGFRGKHTGVGCHFLLQGIFLTQGLNPCLLHWAGSFFTTEPPGKPTVLGNKGKIPGVTRIRVTAMGQRGEVGCTSLTVPRPPASSGVPLQHGHSMHNPSSAPLTSQLGSDFHVCDMHLTPLCSNDVL